ncbi:MAG: hypothetical protein ACOC1V_01640 [Candidatus Saliniplasma sp.]
MINPINLMDIMLQVDEPDFLPGICAGAMCFVWIIPLIIGILIAVWMYKDAEKRDENGILWLIIGLILGIIGLIIWLVVRPDMAEVERKRRGGYQQQYGQQPPQQPPQQQSNQCPNCGGQMRYINEHNRWYCDNCQEYK